MSTRSLRNYSFFSQNPHISNEPVFSSDFYPPLLPVSKFSFSLNFISTNGFSFLQFLASAFSTRLLFNE